MHYKVLVDGVDIKHLVAVARPLKTQSAMDSKKMQVARSMGISPSGMTLKAVEKPVVDEYNLVLEEAQ